MTEPIRILIADDHQILRQGLRSLLERHTDMQLVGEAADGRSAVRMAGELKPDIVIMDVAMPDLNGIEATRQINTGDSGARVVGLSMHSDRRFIAEMLRAGAKGYLLKDSAFDELAGAIRAVVADRVYLSPDIADVVVEDYLRRSPGDRGATGAAAAAGGGGQSSVFNRLSPREREVLQLMAEGKATKEIARELHVSVKTVETHRRQIMTKLDVFSVAELTKYAVREGLTTL